MGILRNLYLHSCKQQPAVKNQFWAIQPETTKRPLEEMNYLFTNAPTFVPLMNMKDLNSHDLEHGVQEAERKGSAMSHVEDEKYYINHR